MLQILGTYQSGTGTAAKNLITQLPLVANEFPEVAGCRPGTINVRLDSELYVVAPDHRTLPIHWNDNDFPDGERFDLLRVNMRLPLDAPEVKAWLYIPHGSPHRSTPAVHEIIAPDVQPPPVHGARCQLSIPRKYCFGPACLPSYLGQKQMYVY